ncbi:hypothetical protein ACO0QE_004565 [Hanseniaspora vineae]
MVEWIAVVYDKPNVDRLKFRTEHLQGIPPAFESGELTSAGAIYKGLNAEGKPEGFAGSVVSVNADSKEEVIAFLKKDPYHINGVWDTENALIYPYGVAKRNAK